MWEVSSSILSSAGAGAGTSAISAISPLSSDLKSKEAEAPMSDLFRWTGYCYIFSAELCLTEFLVTLGIAGV